MAELRRSSMHSIASWTAPHLWVVVSVYLVVFGWMVVAHDGLPYVMDNNESFSAFVHARNLYEYGLERSYGLPDESLAADASGHPYVYTHGGNFPRLPALALYALGARTVESQIAFTTFTAGLLSVLLAYAFLARLAGRGVATTFCLLLITDYVMFTQWNVVTWRIWHGVLLFGVFACTHALARGPSLAAWLALPVLYACLFYYEIVFALFVTCAAATYAALELRTRPGRLVAVYAAGAAGACAAVLLFAAQLVAYLGFEGLVTDLHLTFVARNEITDTEALAQQIRQFAEANGIAYVYNFNDTPHARSLSTLFSWLVRYVLRVYTPWLSLLIGLVSAAMLASRALARVESHLAWRGSAERTGRRRAWSRAVGAARAAAPRERAGQIVAVGLLVFAASVLADGSLIGYRGEHGVLGGTQGLLRTMLGVGATLAGLAFLQARLRASGQGDASRAAVPPPSWLRVIASSALLGCGAVFVRAHEGLYEGAYYHPIWLAVLPAARAAGLLEVAIIAGAAAAAHHVLFGPRRDAAFAAGRGLLRFVACGGVALVAVHLFSPGYVLTGYLKRYAPLTVFFHLVPLAWVTYTLWRDALERLPVALRELRSGARDSGPEARRLWSAAVRTAPLAAALGLSLYWIDLQLTYVRALPADHYAFLERLRHAPFRGASFATNNYAAPVALYAQGFAYVDPALPQAHPHPGRGLERDLRYLWIADRNDAPPYTMPEFFVCMMWVDLRTAVVNLTGDGSRWQPGCSDFGVVRAAMEGRSEGTRLRLLERDASGRDRWAIVELDLRQSTLPVARDPGLRIAEPEEGDRRASR